GVVAVVVIVGLVKWIRVAAFEASVAKAKAESSMPKKHVSSYAQAKKNEAARMTEPQKLVESVKKVAPPQVVVAEEKPRLEKAVPEKVSVEKAPAEKTLSENPPEPKTIKAAAVKNVTAVVRAHSNSWLNVKIDGKTIFQGILKKGNFATWNAVKSVEISGKDIDELEFEVNGKSIGKLSRHDMKARKVRITPEGLTVEK
ncbi:MAG: DUF4115 domain-containing protein, partial [Candidatus Omnitrophica bacterium]|nr:DUF4115 domain-containing protein [Candidatus Omnitrophota bacterium]